MASFPARAAQAAVRPVNLAPVALGTVAAGGLLAAGMAPVALAVAGLSGATFGALVLLDALAAPAGPPPAGPPRAEIASLALRKALLDVDRAAERVTRTIDAHDGVLGPSLAEVRADCAALVDQAADLARRGDAVHRYLAGSDPAELEREVQSRLAAARAATDGDAARSLRQAAEAKRRQLEHRAALRQVFDRIGAELVAVEATLGELHARIVRLTLQDPADALRAGQDAGEGMRALRERIGVLERAARDTLAEIG